MIFDAVLLVWAERLKPSQFVSDQSSDPDKWIINQKNHKLFRDGLKIEKDLVKYEEILDVINKYGYQGEITYKQMVKCICPIIINDKKAKIEHLLMEKRYSFPSERINQFLKVLKIIFNSEEKVGQFVNSDDGSLHEFI